MTLLYSLNTKWCSLFFQGLFFALSQARSSVVGTAWDKDLPLPEAHRLPDREKAT